jgi:hypothetical protein
LNGWVFPMVSGAALIVGTAKAIKPVSLPEKFAAVTVEGLPSAWSGVTLTHLVRPGAGTFGPENTSIAPA